MMKLNVLLFLFFIVLLSCAKKENVNTSYSQKPLVKTVFAYDSILVDSYWYDSEGRLTCVKTLVSYDFDSSVYTYSDKTLEKKTYYAKTLIEIEHSNLDHGNVIITHGIKADSSRYWIIYYTYDNNGNLIREIHMDNDTVETWRVEYKIVDGNIVSMVRIGYLPLTCTYEYYPGTTNSLGSTGISYRSRFLRSKNLVKKILTVFARETSYEEDYTYEYFLNGWVKKSMASGGKQTSNEYYTYW